MKLIQINIWGGKLEYQIQDFIKSQQADIVCMQEVNELEGRSEALFATLNEIMQAGSFNEVDMAPTSDSQYMNRQRRYGNAILTKFPILKRKTIFTSGAYVSGYDVVTHSYNNRNFHHLVLDVSGKKLNVLNHHGFLVVGSKKGNGETVGHMQQIADYVRTLKGPVILCGDFNLAPDCQSMQVFKGLLTDLSSRYGLTNTYTDLNKNKVVCDYIFVNDQITVTDFAMSEELVSDHKALILEFEL